MAVLALAGTEIYGYDLARRLEERGFPVDEGTLYPLLRRLEQRGLLASTWNTDGPRRASTTEPRRTAGGSSEN